MADLTKTIDAVLAQDEQGAPTPILQPNGEPYRAEDGSDATVTFLGPESKRVRAAIAANTRRLMRARKQKFDDADLRANRVEIAIAASTAWHGWTADGAELPCTPENLRVLYRADHILQQAEAAINGHADFFTTSSTD